jgi:apolipoprotein N-acyltransferase
VHLVPFGEYLPEKSWLEALGFQQLTAQRSGFTAGAKRILLHSLPGQGERLGSILPLICYEVAFSNTVRSYPKGAVWIVNVTNDAWFGATIGPRQHLFIARMRAVETGLPVIRAANTGVSAIIDPHGQIQQYLAIESDGILQGKIPGKLPSTIYAQYGSSIFFFFWLLLGALALSIRRKMHFHRL